MRALERVWLSAGAVQDGKSGVARYTVELARALPAHLGGVRLGVVGLARDRRLFPDVGGRDWLEIPARFARGPFNVLWHQLFLPGAARRRGGGLLHIPTYRRLVAFPGTVQVATIHDAAPFHLKGKYDLARRFFGTVWTPMLARRCARVIAVSGATARDVETLMRVPAAKVVTVPNGIDHARFRPPPPEAVEEVRRRHGLRGPYFVYVARLEHPGKNHVRLIEAWEALRRTHPEPVQLVLPGADWHGAEVIRGRAAASPFAADISFPGFARDEELPGLYAGASAMVIPSLMEGFGLPVVEALASGALVLSSDRGSLPEVGGAAAVFFNPEEVPAITAALRGALTISPEERGRRRDAGLRHAARYSWVEAARATAVVYGQAWPAAAPHV